VLTRSAAGSVIVRGLEILTIPAHAVEKVEDVTGAGDLYAAGFLFGFTQRFDLGHCAKLGSLAAAEVISHMGARPDTSLKNLSLSLKLL
jgi:sugar/nucleoside kinase (ribokinase family)